MPLNVGSRLGPYAVTAKIGAGGMGEVYRARDTKLDRAVALKVGPRQSTHTARGSDAARRRCQYWRSDSILSRYCAESRSGTNWFAMSATTVT